MPIFLLETNVKSGLDVVFKSLPDLLAKLLGKPKSYIAVNVKQNDYMSFGGTTEPCALMHLTSIGKLGPEENKKLTANIMEHISKNLNIPQNRMYIGFFDAPRAFVGYDGKTFAQ
ncbi:hypothetical protein SNEBB_005015 [Seison nebaliae]|nr:hypothetical protein SNEBB_005015 [Seison nebaliae]